MHAPHTTARRMPKPVERRRSPASGAGMSSAVKMSKAAFRNSSANTNAKNAPASLKLRLGRITRSRGDKSSVSIGATRASTARAHDAQQSNPHPGRGLVEPKRRSLLAHGNEQILRRCGPYVVERRAHDGQPAAHGRFDRPIVEDARSTVDRAAAEKTFVLLLVRAHRAAEEVNWQDKTAVAQA